MFPRHIRERGRKVKYENIVRCCFSTKREQVMHFHQDIEIIYVLDGSLQINYEEESHHLNAEDFILINSKVRHEYVSEDEVLFGSLFIDYTMLTEIFGGEQPFFWCNSAEEKSESYEKMRYYIRQIFNLYQATEGQAIALKNSIYYQLIYLITSDFIVKKGMKQYDSLRGIQDERMNNIRLDHAVSELLYSDKTILKVAMDNGFSNLASFNQVFKESYQITPAEYRTQMQKKTEASENTENSMAVLEKVEQYLASNLVSTSEAADSVVSVLEVDTKKKEKIKKYWKRMINIGPAENLLRYDVRTQVQYLKEHLGFEYMRFWQVFSEKMMIHIAEKNTKYNFTLLDQVIDFLVGLDIKLHIELGFKNHTIFEKIEPSLLNKNDENNIAMIENNKSFLEELIRHWTRRYGMEVVESWYIEIEKNSVVQENVDAEEYFKVFDTIAGIFKNYAPNIKVGGAGFSLNMMEEEFCQLLSEWKKKKHQPDFISLYSYPYLRDAEILDAGRNPYSSDTSYLYHQIQQAKTDLRRVGMDETELLVTEWSSTLSNRNCINDGTYKSAYIMKNLIENYGEVKALGYWVATDIFSESIDSDEFLFGGCGLISRNGICKPAYYAFDFMNHLEHYILGKNKNAIISYKENGLFFICCHNYKHLNFRYYSRNENEIELENQQRYYSDNESMQMSFKIDNVNNGIYIIKTFSISQISGNVQNEWKELDYFNDLSLQEVDYLKKWCQPKLTIRKVEAVNHTLIVETRIAAQEIQGIVVGEL